MAKSEIEELEQQIGELTQKLGALRKENRGEEVRNYPLATVEGEVGLHEMFGGRDKLLVIHNMGQGCRYCTLWADGFNGFVPHLESAMGVVLVSKDAPELQRRFANSRGWRFRLASHGGGDYMREQISPGDGENEPGAAVYEKVEGKVYRKNVCEFGPGDMYCSMWSLLALAGLDEESWTPQYSYWQRPKVMEDGGVNVLSEEGGCCE